MSPVLTVFINNGMVLVIWLGGLQSIDGILSRGQIVAFTNYLLATMNPLIMITQLSNTWANGLASARRINEVLDTVPEVEEPLEPIALSGREASAVLFDDVGFHYHGHAATAVLEHIDLDGRPGRVIAILGATGSGKTTLINMIPRFYEATNGTVRVDGLDVKSVAHDSLLERRRSDCRREGCPCV